MRDRVALRLIRARPLQPVSSRIATGLGDGTVVRVQRVPDGAPMKFGQRRVRFLLELSVDLRTARPELVDVAIRRLEGAVAQVAAEEGLGATVTQR